VRCELFVAEMPDLNAAYLSAHRRRERAGLYVLIVRGMIIESAGWMKSHPITRAGEGSFAAARLSGCFASTRTQENVVASSSIDEKHSTE